MVSSDIRTSQSANDSDRLLRLLVVTAMVSMVVIVLLSAYGFYRIFSGFVITSAQNDSVRLSSLMIDQQKPLLFAATSSQTIELIIHETDILPLDRNLRHFLKPFGIIKIKIYDRHKRIIYCTDPKLIGKVDESNVRLRNALSGNIDAKLETKDKVQDLAEEALFNVDVVETYVPIMGETGTVLGSFEVYVNVTHYRDQIRQGVIVMTLLLVLVLAGVFGFSYLLIRRGAGQLRQAQAQLETLAKTDALTDVANRGHLMVRGQEEFERLRRHRLKSQPTLMLGSIMLDLDHFKRINDTKGHQAGDHVLRGVAQRLRESVRPYDVIGRYGGEEFAVLLPDTNLEQCLVVAERIRVSISHEPFEHEGDSIPVTVSLGVSCSSESDQGLNDLLKRADEGLYKAKEAGRNRVACVYQPFDSEIHS
ncbi:MAG: GGDEF domain-containing protein [Verrucomicrobia bacterium]|nr:GGDEF domain-containing protein [Deltaproteobacteria bacterium]